MIDGEIVAFDSAGRPSFNVLRNNLNAVGALHYYVFDLMVLRGVELTRLPLEKERLLVDDAG